MAAVMIGVDPHKGSHTAVAIGQAEMALGEVRVRAAAAKVQRLLAWATTLPVPLLLPVTSAVLPAKSCIMDYPPNF